MAVINDVIKKAFRNLGVIGEGGSLSGPQLAEGLEELNTLVDSLNLSNVFPYYVKRESFTLTPGINEYTIGPGGDFDTVRPLGILHATLSKNGLAHPMNGLDYQDWMDIYNKASQSQIPRWFYYEQNHALGVLHINYTPSEANSIILAVEALLPEYSKGEALSVPPGYKKALTDALTMELWDKYPDDSIYDTLNKKANNSMRRLEKVNFKNLMVPAQVDIGVLPRPRDGGKYFNA